eukprot:3134627-Prorocentrum_lima.AAC.1
MWSLSRLGGEGWGQIAVRAGLSGCAAGAAGKNCSYTSFVTSFCTRLLYRCRLAVDPFVPPQVTGCVAV